MCIVRFWYFALTMLHVLEAEAAEEAEEVAAEEVCQQLCSLNQHG